MTTIVYCDDVIAYDSRCTADSTIVDDDFNKHVRTKDADFFLCGSTADFSLIISAYCGEAVTDKLHSGGFAYDGETLWLIGHDDGAFWKSEIARDRFYAVGSGDNHAWTAMDLGCTAREAVKMAAKRDSCTGGRIRTFKLK